MATMNVSLPDELRAVAEARVASGHYANVSDYVRDLIRHDQEQAEKAARLRAAIDEGLASGVSELSAEDIRRQVKAERHG